MLQESPKKPFVSYSITSVKRCLPIIIVFYDIFSLSLFIYFCYLTFTAISLAPSFFSFFQFFLHLVYLYSCIIIVLFIVCYSLLIFFKPIKYRLQVHTFTEENIFVNFSKITCSLIQPQKIREHRIKNVSLHRRDFDELHYTNSHITLKRHRFPIHKFNLNKKQLHRTINFIKKYHKPDFVETKK